MFKSLLAPAFCSFEIGLFGMMGGLSLTYLAIDYIYLALLALISLSVSLTLMAYADGFLDFLLYYFCKLGATFNCSTFLYALAILRASTSNFFYSSSIFLLSS